jgi:D-glycero-D-manno-heptose 1,7-bisphosphate phosphatase
VKRALLLDRDGTLVDVVRDEETGAITTAFHPSQLRLLPGVIEALRAARTAGFSLGIVTNQPGPAKGHFSRAAVTRTNDALVAMLGVHGIAIETVRVCMHHPDGAPEGERALITDCGCRKPKPGLLLDALADLSADASLSFMIGDTAVDVAAGRAAGVKTGLVFPAGRCELCPLRGGPSVSADVTGATLGDVVSAILARA